MVSNLDLKNANLTNYINLSNDCSQYSEARLKFLLELTDTILIVYPWIMIIFGTLSNTISFIVLTKPKLRKSSTFFYLSCLSVIDLIQLYTFCVNFIFLYQFKIDIQLEHVILCKLYSFLIYFLPQFSAWTCVAVSLDRVVGVIFSVRGRYSSAAKKWNTPKIALRVMIAIFLSLLMLNLQFFFYPNEYVFGENDSVQDVNIIYCSPEHIPRFQSFYSFWVHIDLSVNVLIPFGIMIASSFIIVIGILRSTKNLNKNKPAGQSSVRSNLERSNSVAQSFRLKSFSDRSEQSIKSRKSISFLKRASVSFSSNVSSKAKSVSYMLATNNIVFISLTLPIVLFLTLAPSFSMTDMCDFDKAKLRFVKVICIILMNCNCSINIFIYSFMASEFRIQLILLFRRALFCFSSHSRFQLTNFSSLKTNRPHSSAENQDSSQQNRS